VQTSVNGGGDTLWLGGSGNQISLYNTGSNADAINGANAVLILNGVAASVTGNGNQVYLHGSNTLALNGTGETLFADKAFALDTITGFVASDHIQFAAADFANFAALMGATRQSGADTVITLDAKDVITLKNVTASALTSSQFSFV